MKKMISAVMILIMLICMVTVSASSPGTTGDPLVSQSYLEGAYARSLRTDISNVLGSAADKAMSRLDELYKDYIGYSFTPKFIRVSIPAGSAVAISTGASFILLSGTATLTVTSGTVLNLTTGSEVPTGSQLVQYNRYFCAENTTARISATAAATGQVDGYYILHGDSEVSQPLPFTDVFENDWYHTAVEFAFKEGLFSGTTATTFSPRVSMTRGMFVTVLHRLDKLPATGAGGIFSDVNDPASYYYNAVTWASENNIVTGHADGTFKPNDSITREQMAVTMHRYATYKERDISSAGTTYDSFPDREQVSGYAEEAMRWTVAWGIISGSDGRLLPQNTATRAEVAQIILNYCDKIGR